VKVFWKDSGRTAEANQPKHQPSQQPSSFDNFDDSIPFWCPSPNPKPASSTKAPTTPGTWGGGIWWTLGFGSRNVLPTWMD